MSMICINQSFSVGWKGEDKVIVNKSCFELFLLVHCTLAHLGGHRVVISKTLKLYRFFLFYESKLDAIQNSYQSTRTS